MKIEFILPIFIIIFAFVSCENVLVSNIQIQKESQRLVVNGHIANDSLFYVSVTNTIPIGVPTSQVRNISNAKVEYYEDGVLIGQATAVPSVYPIPNLLPSIFFRSYYVLPWIGKPGKTYDIRVSAPGFRSVKAFDLIPEIVPALPEWKVIVINRNNLTADIEFELLDNDPNENWYHVVIYLREKILKEILYPLTMIRDESELIETDFNGVLFPGGLNSGILISDAIFTEDKRTFIVKTDLIQIFDRDFQNYELSLEVRSVSKNYYDYYISIIEQERTREDIFSQPTYIFNNIEGGLGNFSGYLSAKSNWVSLR